MESMIDCNPSFNIWVLGAPADLAVPRPWPTLLVASVDDLVLSVDNQGHP